MSGHAYGVQQQEARQDMLADFFRGGILSVLALILIGIGGLSSLPEIKKTEATVSPTALAATPIPSTETPKPDTLPTLVTPLASPTSPVNTPTAVPTDTPVATDTPVIPIAVVNSPNGLWLRETPGGVQEVELIPNGAELVLLPGQEVVDDLEWQQVRTPVGNEGWVAVEFIIYQ